MYRSILMQKKIYLLLAILTIGLLLPANSFAQNENSTKDVGITVSPITDEFTIKPGEVTTRVIQVVNPNDRVVTLYPHVLNFNTDNENGQPVFFSGNDESKNYTLSSWVTFSQPFVRIAKNEIQLVEVTIAAPSEAEPGGHYGAVLFSTEKPSLDGDEPGKVGVVGLVGTLLLASVPGDLVEKLDIDQFGAPFITFAPPFNTSVTFKNSGNIHLKPTGEITIKNWSGNQSGFININEGGGNVLPESRRKFDGEWRFDPLRSFGLYTLTLRATYGGTPSEIVATKKVLIVPVWLIIAILLLASWIGYRIVTTLVKRKKAVIKGQFIQPQRRILQ